MWSSLSCLESEHFFHPLLYHSPHHHRRQQDHHHLQQDCHHHPRHLHQTRYPLPLPPRQRTSTFYHNNQHLHSSGSYPFKNKLQKLEDALVEQMLTWLIGLTGLIGLTMRKM